MRACCRHPHILESSLQRRFAVFTLINIIFGFTSSIAWIFLGGNVITDGAQRAEPLFWFLYFAFSSITLAGYLTYSAQAKLNVALNGATLLTSRFSFEYASRFSMSLFLCNLAVSSLWVTLGIKSGIVQLLAFSSIFAVFSFVFPLGNSSSEEMAAVRVDQNFNKRTEAGSNRFTFAHCLTLSLLPISFNAFMKTARAFRFLMTGVSRPWAQNWGIDILTALLLVELYFVRFSSENIFAKLLKEKLDFEVVSEVSEGIEATPASDLLLDALAIGRYKTLDQLETKKDKCLREGDRTIVTKFLPGWRGELQRQQEALILMVEEAKKRSSAGKIPSLEEVMGVPLWAAVMRRHAYKALAVHTPKKAGRELRFEIYKNCFAGVLRCCCLEIDTFTLQVQALAFDTNRKIAHAVLSGGVSDPPGGAAFLAHHLIRSPNLIPNTKRTVGSVLNTLAERIKNQIKFANGVKINPNFIEEVEWAIQGGASLIESAMSESPMAGTDQMAPCFMSSLAGGILSLRALKRARDEVNANRSKTKLKVWGDERELESLKDCMREGLVRSIGACRKEIGRFAFSPPNAAVMKECITAKFY